MSPYSDTFLYISQNIYTAITTSSFYSYHHKNKTRLMNGNVLYTHKAACQIQNPLHRIISTCHQYLQTPHSGNNINQASHRYRKEACNVHTVY